METRRTAMDSTKDTNDSSRNNNNKRPAPTPKNKPQKKGKFLSLAEVKAYISERWCFLCGEVGHRKGDCPTKGTKTEVAPSTNAVPDLQGNTSANNNERKLLKAWGSVNGRRVLILLDPDKYR